GHRGPVGRHRGRCRASSGRPGRRPPARTVAGRALRSGGRGAAANLPWTDGSFTAVVANFLLPHLAVSIWEVPERAAVLGIVVAAVAEAGATPPAHLPPGAPFFAYSSDDALTGLLHDAGLDEIEVLRLSFTHRVASADELWDGVLGGTVRTSALVAGQPAQTQRRIRVAFDRLAAGYAVDGGLELPVSVKIASGNRFTDLVGSELPLQSAGMGLVAGVDLAAAVTTAGGLGMLGPQLLPPDAFEAALSVLAERTAGRPFGVNFLGPFLDPHQVEIAARRARVVEFFYGDPDPELVRIARSAGALVCWQVGSATEARQAVAAGCDLGAAWSSRSAR
ncbi:MAG: nitronate monooxygenase, partial [Pseudonocardiaceae bacterium]